MVFEKKKSLFAHRKKEYQQTEQEGNHGSSEMSTQSWISIFIIARTEQRGIFTRPHPDKAKKKEDKIIEKSAYFFLVFYRNSVPIFSFLLTRRLAVKSVI